MLHKAVTPPFGDTCIIPLLSPYGIGFEAYSQGIASLSATATWPSANLIIYIPFWVPRPSTAYKVFCTNGSAVSGHVDVGIYRMAGGTMSRLASAGGAGTQTGTGTMQTFDITDQLLLPGNLYYVGTWLDNNTGAMRRGTPTAPMCAALGVMQEAGGAGALPDPATPVFSQTLNYIPGSGVILRSYA